MNFSIRSKALWLIACFALAGSAFVVRDADANKGGQSFGAKLSEAQQQKLFETHKEWELSSADNRIAIINEFRNCIDAAQPPESFRNCKQKGRQSHRALKEQHRKKINATLKSMGLEPMQSHLKHGHHKGRENNQRIGPKLRSNQV